MSQPEPVGAEGFAILREEFKPEAIGKLPRVTCQDCSKSRDCRQHIKKRCNDCGAYISTAHIHLDYCGHGAVTDRLLQADPYWTWEPVGWTPEGLPLISKGAGGELILWGRLTVCGHTRLGVGSVTANSFDAEKQLIGDFLRNAAMRFGVGLDLWSKTELESRVVEPEPPASADQREALTERALALPLERQAALKDAVRAAGLPSLRADAVTVSDAEAWARLLTEFESSSSSASGGVEEAIGAGPDTSSLDPALMAPFTEESEE